MKNLKMILAVALKEPRYLLFCCDSIWNIYAASGIKFHRMETKHCGKELLSCMMAPGIVASNFYSEVLYFSNQLSVEFYLHCPSATPAEAGESGKEPFRPTLDLTFSTLWVIES